MMPHKHAIDQGSHGESTYLMLKEARASFGLARIQMGAALVLIRDHDLWEGRATSFSAFLASEHIDPHAARKYMKVARTFIFDCGMEEDDVAELSHVSMSVLERAAEVITKTNRQEVVGIVTRLAKRDAFESLSHLEKNEFFVRPELGLKDLDPRVKKLMSEFISLPEDLKTDFWARMMEGKNASTPRQRESPRFSRGEV